MEDSISAAKEKEIQKLRNESKELDDEISRMEKQYKEDEERKYGIEREELMRKVEEILKTLESNNEEQMEQLILQAQNEVKKRIYQENEIVEGMKREKEEQEKERTERIKIMTNTDEYFIEKIRETKSGYEKIKKENEEISIRNQMIEKEIKEIKEEVKERKRRKEELEQEREKKEKEIKELKAQKNIIKSQIEAIKEDNSIKQCSEEKIKE
ncbi:hypothetical protein, conserved [Entamoeba dispar SAW760]|uniref:Uncharacterized protein n=1 Tax=Entamoeba dispar (strain ATCC PRA-260 / SAW760) TaxID=370354 RepID=B0E7N0_ENTDS|nr:uncharacterized protein EDI_262170 [Entamoeba dispar SAW760]EDR29466.1 hypothetical protein, conserved [Entamoeba dispar SAW760]|eukprot:EDR29466.1 hypothetical protein, conserved [Entamoeba dispar SAW760]